MTHVLRLFIPFALGYFLSFLFRVVNSVIATDLTTELGLTASELGLISSAYFLTFAVFQIPLGILLDRYGPRRVEASLLLFAVAGAVVFAQASDLSELILGRALIGLGVSACLMAAFKAYVVWFDVSRLALVNGLQLAAGGLGALMGTVPVQAAMEFTDWRGIFMFLAVMAAIIAVLVFVVVPKGEQEGHSEPLKEQLNGMLKVIHSPVFWRIAPLSIIAQAVLLAIQTLWIGPWLQDVAGLSQQQAAIELLWIAGALTAGFLLNGLITMRLGKWGIQPMAVAIGGMLIFMLVQCGILLINTSEITNAWLLFAFFGTFCMIPYAALSKEFPKHLNGRLITLLNLQVFILAFVMQWLFGVILDIFLANKTSGYPPEGYQAAMAIFLVLQALAVVWLIFFRKGALNLYTPFCETRTPS